MENRHEQTAAYAAAGIPLYLLIDVWAPAGSTVTLYEEPTGDVYRLVRTVKFGDTIRLPEPFGMDLDTGVFPAQS